MTGPYRKWIAEYRTSGLHPFPVDGKRPCVTSYAARRPSLAALDRWVEAFPQANLGLPTCRERLAVLDADDPDAIALFDAFAGDTPLRVQTRRGQHWYFADPRNEIASATHPGGQAFDVRASGPADYVLLPGSQQGAVTYRLVGDEDVSIAEFARRLRELPRLDGSRMRDLLRQPRGLVPVRQPAAARSGTVVLKGARVPVGARNSTLFHAACRDAHDIRRRFGDTDQGLAALIDRVQAYNEALCAEALSKAEVEKLVQSAWSRTLSGVNRPPTRHRRHVREALRRIGRETRALALWGWLSQSNLDTSDVELAPGQLSAVIPNWKTHDAQAAIKALVAAGILRLLQPGGRGRGKKARYRMTEPLVSEVSFDLGLQRLDGDAAALMLLVFLVDVWGDAATAPISAEGMSQTVGGPFGGWTKVKIVQARDHLSGAGLIDRLEVPRAGVRLPRALFQVRAADVLKIPENVPVDIHRPPGWVGMVAASITASTPPIAPSSTRPRRHAISV